MTEHHDHRNDCPFKFSTLDVCDCVEKNMLDRIEALTEQLAAARQDAKFAEDELELQEQEACMMENDYIKLEKERDALEAKLAKAVEALLLARVHVANNEQGWSVGRASARSDLKIINATLAEVEGEKT